MSENKLFSTVLRSVESKYGSLDEPNYAFVKTEIQTSEQRAILSKLENKGTTIVEHTDINDDVSINVTLGGKLGLWLSLIGPFAMLRRIGDGENERMIVAPNDCKDDLESLVVSTVLNEGVTFLGRKILLKPLPLAVPNRPKEETRVYHALFSDDDEDAFL
jgi:hypothetical protein